MTRFRDREGKLIVKGSKSQSKKPAKTRQSKKVPEIVKTRSVKRTTQEVPKKNPIKSTRSSKRRLTTNDKQPKAISTDRSTKKLEKKQKEKEPKEKPIEKPKSPEKSAEPKKTSMVDVKQSFSESNMVKMDETAKSNKVTMSREERIENRNKIKEVI